MQELDLEELDRTLIFIQNPVTVYIRDAQDRRCRITVLKRDEDDFLVDVAFWGYTVHGGKRPESHTYQCTKFERNQIVTELGCGPESLEWVGGNPPITKWAPGGGI